MTDDLVLFPSPFGCYFRDNQWCLAQPTIGCGDSHLLCYRIDSPLTCNHNPDGRVKTGVAPPRSRGEKQSAGKLPYDLLPVPALEQILEIFQMGAEKYTPRNWEKGIPWLEAYAALMRHVNQWRQGVDLDPESGKPHLAHAGFWVLALLTYAATHPEMDDRTIK